MGEGLCRVMLAVGWGKVVKSGSKALKSPSLLALPSSRLEQGEGERGAALGGLQQQGVFGRNSFAWAQSVGLVPKGETWNPNTAEI